MHLPTRRTAPPIDLVGSLAGNYIIHPRHPEAAAHTNSYCRWPYGKRRTPVPVPVMATPPKRRALDTVGEKVLRKVLDHRDKVYEQLSVYLQLRNVIERLQETNHSELYMQVDLGCNFFVDTVVPDTSRIYVALGYGFFLELTLAEALKFIDRKSSLLTELSDSLTKDSMNIKAHIHMMLEGLRELQGLQNFPEPSPH